MTSSTQREIDDARKEASGAKEIKATFQPFDPGRGYDKGYFLKTYNAHKDLTEHLQEHLRDKTDPKAAIKLAVDIYGQPNAFDIKYQSNPLNITHDAQTHWDGSSDRLSAYSYKNLESMLGVIDREERKPERQGNPNKSFYVGLVKRIKTYNTRGKDEDHDALAAQIKKYQMLVEILKIEDQSERTREMVKVVANDIKENHDDEATAHLIQFYAHRGQDIMEHFAKIVKREEMVLDKVLTPERARSVVKKYIEIVQEQYDKEDYDLGKKEDIMRNELDPLLGLVARGVYDILDAEKTKEDEAKNPKKKDKNIRKKERREMGLSY